MYVIKNIVNLLSNFQLECRKKNAKNAMIKNSFFLNFVLEIMYSIILYNK